VRDILLDTHLFLWSQFESGKLSTSLRELFASPDIRWHLSQVSFLEIQIKHSLGKLELPKTPEQVLPELLEQSGLHFEPLSNEAIFMLAKLPPIHRDPFDRLLIGAALVKGWEVATVDPVFDRYPIRTVA
jgi:PIN domain nuclease of toxin-antitoxin system